MNRNIKDVLAHLHQWHVMMIGWYDCGMKGEKPDIPAKEIPGRPHRNLVGKFAMNIRIQI
ncbi:MAG: ClbS/DfsB family four-helix bundle protein [Saprospiraceae bacterium]|nr:ClbS/DfsB family four-helix bundle protein [Saprospiraceae bacterium]